MTPLKNPHNWTCYRDTTRWKEERIKLLVRRRRIINFANNASDKICLMNKESGLIFYLEL
jgi:hypothetical protein